MWAAPVIKCSSLRSGAVEEGMTQIWSRAPNLRERLVHESESSGASVYSFSGTSLLVSATQGILRCFSSSFAHSVHHAFSATFMHPNPVRASRISMQMQWRSAPAALFRFLDIFHSDFAAATFCCKRVHTSSGVLPQGQSVL